MCTHVSSGEGFNLRRDVHMRAATLVRILQEKTGRGYEWVLVLPPWPRLYHWKSSGQVPYQPWAKYFDLPSLNRFVPSIEFDVYLQLNGHLIDEVRSGLNVPLPRLWCGCCCLGDGVATFQRRVYG